MILVDKRQGSRQLGERIEPQSIVQFGEYDADVAFLGYGPGGDPVPLGLEYKKVPDVLACIRDGRFSGEQLPKMLDAYGAGRIYLLIEGAYRVDELSGILELRVWDPRLKKMTWKAAQLGRDAWLYRQLDAWIHTMTEMVGLRVWRTWDIEESAAYVKNLYVWWTSKNYDDHRSHLKWASPNTRLEAANRRSEAHNILVPQRTVDLPLRQLWANDLPLIGPEKSVDIRRHFPSAFAMAMADEREWAKIKGIGKLSATRIVAAIQAEDK